MDANLRTIDERIMIARNIADAYKRGESNIKDGCTKNGITRMSLWYWEHKYPAVRDIIRDAIENRKAAFKKRRDELFLKRAGRPEGWNRVKPVFVKVPASNDSNRKDFSVGLVLTCVRCGHVWKPRRGTVVRCPHKTCLTVFFAVDGRFSDVEKKKAHEDRHQFDISAPGRRMKPMESESANGK